MHLFAALAGCTEGPSEPLVCDAPTVATQVYDIGTLDEREGARAPTGLAFADLDGDGQREVWYANSGGSEIFDVIDGQLVATDRFLVDGAAPPVGVAIAAADPDRDGDQDIFLGTWSGSPDLFLRNDGSGSYTSEELPASDGFATSGLFADFDEDGDLDLFVSRGWAPERPAEDVVNEHLPGDPSSLYLWGEGWVDASDWIPAEVQPAHTFQAAPLDADEDGDLDLWLANDFGPYVVPDALLVNEGDRFRVSESARYAHYGMGAAVGDADGDGAPDLFVTDVGGPDLLLGLPDATFIDATLARGAALGHEPDRLTSWAARFLDVDGDGDDDLPVAFGRLDSETQDWVGALGEGWTASDDQRDALLLANGDGTFTDAGDALGFADPERTRAMVVGDLDGDHIAEVIVAGKNHIVVYRFGGGCPSRAVLEVEGDASTTTTGAQVDLFVDDRWSRRWVNPSVTGSSSANEVFLGLGYAESAEVEVTWPDGRSTRTSLSVGERLVLAPPG